MKRLVAASSIDLSSASYPSTFMTLLVTPAASAAALRFIICCVRSSLVPVRPSSPGSRTMMGTLNAERGRLTFMVW